MKQKTNKRTSAFLKVAVVAIVLLFSGATLVSFKAEKMYADLWQQLGIGKSSGTEKIKESFLGGYLQFYGVRNIKKIVAGDRAATAKDLLEYTRQYVQSEAFKKEYNKYREDSKPREPQPAKTLEEIQKERIADLTESIAKTEKSVKNTTDPSLKKIFEDAIVKQKQNLKEYQDPNYKILKLMAKGEQQTYEYNKKRFDEDTQKWSEKYPVNHMEFVKLRLQEVLKATEGVDFDAELKESYGKKVFVNPTYERKNDNWKYAFRAGKEVTETVRKYVEKWISEIK